MTAEHQTAGGRQKGAARRLLRPANLLWLVLTLLLAGVVVTNRQEAAGVLDSARAARPGYLLAAIAIQMLFVINLARFYAATFRASGLRANLLRFALLTSASHFVNLVSKTTGLGGLAIYLREAERTQDATSRVGAAYLVAYFLGYLAFFLVLGVALLLLYLRGALTGAIVGASGIVLGLALAIFVVVLVSLRSRAALTKLFGAVADAVNRLARALRRRQLLDADAARDMAGGLYEAVDEMRRRPWRYLTPFAHALGVELISAAQLFVVARAFNVSIGVDVAVICYALSLLFSLVAITPAGMGLVEASLSVLLISFGVPRSNAIATAITFRLFDFWLPLLLGAISLAILAGLHSLPAAALPATDEAGEPGT